MPQRDWSLVGVTDLGEPTHDCPFCSYQGIRYVHHLAHEGWPDGLDVGCVCAELLTGDYVTPKRLEADLKNRLKRRSNWPTRSGWRLNDKGNWCLRYQGEQFYVGPRNAGWKAADGAFVEIASIGVRRVVNRWPTGADHSQVRKFPLGEAVVGDCHGSVMTSL